MKEKDIRDRETFNKYLELVKKDIDKFFDFNLFVQVDCPACSQNNYQTAFKKAGFIYVLCRNCSTLFVNPRPRFSALKDFYSSSSSMSFFVNEFFKPVAQARRNKIFAPRAKYVSQILRKKQNMMIGDIGAGFGIFLDEIKKILPNNNFWAIEPSWEMIRNCEINGFRVKNAYFEELKFSANKFDLLTSFELTEHLFDPVNFFKKVNFFLKPGGILFFTTLNGLGFDIQVLWEKSKSVFPPHHLNFLNPYSVKILLEKLNFQVMEISTPGKLDWDIVESAIKNDDLKAGRFWEFLAGQTNEKCKSQLQAWISRNNLSSHLRVLASKKHLNT